MTELEQVELIEQAVWRARELLVTTRRRMAAEHLANIAPDAEHDKQALLRQCEERALIRTVQELLSRASGKDE